jgi:mRNA interferase MazF
MHSEQKPEASTQVSKQNAPLLPKPVRGDVFKARLDPTEGSEQAGSRPVVVLSRDSINANSRVVVVVPVTDAMNVKRIYPMHAHLSKGEGGLRMDSIVKTEQIRAIEIGRFVEYYGRLDSSGIKRIEQALKIALALA